MGVFSSASKCNCILHEVSSEMSIHCVQRLGSGHIGPKINKDYNVVTFKK